MVVTQCCFKADSTEHWYMRNHIIMVGLWQFDSEKWKNGYAIKSIHSLLHFTEIHSSSLHLIVSCKRNVSVCSSTLQNTQWLWCWSQRWTSLLSVLIGHTVILCLQCSSNVSPHISKYKHTVPVPLFFHWSYDNFEECCSFIGNLFHIALSQWK
jgi:hypothetical protein